jgi:ABC-2 type transport system permease protein
MSTLALPLPSPARRAAFSKIVHNEARLTWRMPVGLIGGIGIPMVLLIIFGEIPALHVSSPDFGGLTAFDVYVPILAVFGVALIALWGLPGPLVSYREQGILRRLSTTPVPPSWLLAAQVVVQLCIALTAFLLVIVVSMTAFGAPVPKNPGGLLLSCLLSVAGLFPLGLLIAAVARTTTGASVIGRLTFFPLMFFAGLWLPRALMPPVLLTISNYSPLGAAVQAIQDSMLQGFPPAMPLLVLAAYPLVFGYLARRFFRWE